MKKLLIVTLLFVNIGLCKAQFILPDSVKSFSNESVKIKEGPLFIIDGIEASEIEFKKINTDNIRQLDVLKDSTQTSIYGEKGKYGVLIMYTKQAHEKQNDSHLDHMP